MKADGGAATGINASLALYALPPAPVVTLTPNGANADLAWEAITEDTAGKLVTIQRYEVWYSAAAYFAINDPGRHAVNRTVPNYTDTGALTTPGGRFYLVRALTDRGGYSPASNKTAKFTFALVPGGQ